MTPRNPPFQQKAGLLREVMVTLIGWALVLLCAAALRSHLPSGLLPSWLGLLVLTTLALLGWQLRKHLAKHPALFIPVSRACSCVLLLVSLLSQR